MNLERAVTPVRDGSWHQARFGMVQVETNMEG